ncbi:MAG: type IV toxin-antitoxin system AbiEi family antitoxin domain-containing protein, partial [Gemmatimonadales bacterium]
MIEWLSAGREVSVVSHESALAMHEISDIIPSSIHVTVPRSRRWYKGGAEVTIHTVVEPLKDSEIVVRDGIKLTEPARTIADAAEWG